MENKITIHDAEIMYHSADFTKLLTFFLSAATNTPCEISERAVHGAFNCLKAQDKRNVELCEHLSHVQKEIEKQAVDEFYDNFEKQLTSELERRCNVRMERV